MNSKTKNIIAVAGFFLALIVCYKFTFSETLAHRKNYQHLKKEVQLFKDIPQQLSVLYQKEKYYDSLQRTFQITETSFQNTILKTINTAAETHNFNVIEFNEPHIFEENDIRKNSYSFTVEGSFMSILKLTHHLEQKTKFGEIIHYQLEKKKDPRTRKERLQARIIIQNIN